MIDPIDVATLALLRPLVADLEAGRVLVRALRAHDKKGQGLTITWAPRADASEHAERTTAPAEQDFLPPAAPRCPRGCTTAPEALEGGGWFCAECEAELPD